MGCTASNDTSDYLHQIEALRAQMEENKTKAHEQQNLLRFKVEVLVNMLAVEEKRSEETTKRIDTMQWLLAKQGINETSLNQILLNLDAGSQEKFHATVASAKLDDRILMPDVGTVVDKMRDEFTNNRDDILHAFCRADGKIVSSSGVGCLWVPLGISIASLCGGFNEYGFSGGVRPIDGVRRMVLRGPRALSYYLGTGVEENLELKGGRVN